MEGYLLYLTCLHCDRSLAPGRRQFCGPLCKSAEFKRVRALRAADDQYWESISSQAAYDLTDVECYAIEARVASMEQHVFDGNGFRVRDAQQEHNAERIGELRESWADKGADLDVWAVRRLDRARYGGIVLTPELFAELEDVRQTIASDEDFKWFRTGDPLLIPDFHNKTFTFDLDAREIAGIAYNINQLLPPNRKEIYAKLNDLARDSYLRSTYGITLVDYQRMLDSQGGGCFGCGKTVQEEGIWLAVDHDHSSGAVRGVLCRACNTTLGFVRDTPSTLRRLADYLEHLADAA